MRFVVYIDREGSPWPPRERVPSESVSVEVTPRTAFGDAVAEALQAAGEDVRALYYYPGHEPPVYWPYMLRDARNPESELLRFPQVAISEDGQFLWTWGARDQATFADYVRAREAGFFEGDPYGVFLERPMYGDGLIPGWEELIQWLQEGAVVGMAAWLISFFRRHFSRWEERGATTPVAFIDIVVARKEWDRAQLSQLLGIQEEEAATFLTELGYVPIDAVGRTRWVWSDDPDKAALRKHILRDFMHSHEE